MAPVEKVAIFDEAQRAWNKESLADFMRRKNGFPILISQNLNF